MGRFGNWNKRIELFELFEETRRDSEAFSHILEAGGVITAEERNSWLQEGTGAPEGRADFPNFLLAVIRHKVREAFAQKAPTWDRYVGIERAEDFREHTASQLNGIRGIREIREGGEYNRMTSSEEALPSFAVSRHGGMYELTFEMIVNDEVNRMLNRIPAQLGVASAQYVTQVIIALIEANGNWIDGVPFFHATHGNLYTSTAADPTETNFATWVSNMKLRRDTDGVPIDLSAKWVLVRSELDKMILDKIINSQVTQLVTVGSGVQAAGTFSAGTMNPLNGALAAGGGIIDDPYLNDPNDIYIFADNEDRPAFIASFWRGQREPFIGMKESDAMSAGGGSRDPYQFYSDGVEFKVRHVFGASQGHYQSAAKAVRA